ncbi:MULTISPECIES: helix-turn-helix transcriptional regulator [unclassified Pseudomonas]|uniref:helix-turn-helix transcriptional regulator n=2 Tax=unclassified Pseudomonas TaxID=196821 RepID=UPI001CBE6DC9|nr:MULTISPECIES: AlpA family phage regulatory protein [unclassified Pseudomonas]
MPSKAGTDSIDRFMRLNEVLHVTGLGRNTVYRRIREGTIPKQIRIGPPQPAWRSAAIAPHSHRLKSS